MYSSWGERQDLDEGLWRRGYGGEEQPASEGGRYRTPGALAPITLAGLKTAATTAKADPSLRSG